MMEDDSSENTTSFTVDITNTNIEVPSISKLLNRKSLTDIRIAMRPPTPERTQPVIIPTKLKSPSTGPAPKVQPAVKKPSSQRPPLTIWDEAALKATPDPIGRAIQILLEKKAKQLLFLSKPTGSTAGPADQYTSTAAVFPGQKLELWTGLQWDPKLVPEVWEAMRRSRWVEFASPRELTFVGSNRNVIRAAFGVTSDEWLLLALVGPVAAYRGLLAAVSEQSLLAEMTEALPYLSQ